MSLPELTERILIVDDIPTNLRLLSQILLERGYEVRAVTNGTRALASIGTDPPDLVLLDIRMPGKDGYEVCRQIKENERSQDIPILFISSLDDIDDKVQAFAAGGVDYITKPFQIEEVVARVETHLSLRRLQRNLQAANQRMQRELILAGQVQSSMMPHHLSRIPGWQLAVQLVPAKLTCGDFYDVVSLPDGNIAILIADVVDKGVGAALYMAMCCAVFRTYIHEFPHSPEKVFRAANQRLLADIETDQFVTTFLGILNPTNGELTYANAGHNPPILIHRDPPEKYEMLIRTGTVLGVLEDLQWTQQTVTLQHGDLLVLYTDGITEAENLTQDFYGTDRLVKVLIQNSKKSVDEIRATVIADLHEFVHGAEQSDDIALLVLARQ